MKCEFCKNDMKFIHCTDDPNNGYAYNLYVCPNCDSVCKDDVWENKGQYWLNNDSTTVFTIKFTEN